MVAIYPEFFNDVFGPIMQPGSSSHMAAPCRGGYLCNSLLGEPAADILVELDKEGSFSGTFGLMNEDLGMLNGAMGKLPYAEDFFDIKAILKEKGISYRFDFCVMKESQHINSMKFILTGISGKKATLVVNSTGGGMIETVWVNGYAFSGCGDTPVVFIYDKDCSIDGEALAEIVRANAVVLESGTGGSQNRNDAECGGCEAVGRMFWFKIEGDFTGELKSALSCYQTDCMKPVLPVITTRRKAPQLFDTMTDWRRLAKEQNKSMTEVAIDYEIAASGWDREEVIGYMRDTVQKCMHRRVHALYEEDVVTATDPFTKLYDKSWAESEKDNMLQGALFRSMYYMNGAFPDIKGVLNVPGPMGIGGGLIYAVLSALKDEYGYSDDELLDALFVAAGVGAICYTRSAPTGEVTGCTGEVGCCTAMAAAAVVQLRGGTPEQMENAASFALQASIGWPCDPVPGSGAMACRTRIMYTSVMSIAYAQQAMIGGDAVIPFHEEVDLMDSIGRNLHPDLLCTSRGGHCATPTGRACIERFGAWRAGNLL